MKADFSGYATKAGLKCSDGRTIMPDAFKHQDKTKVPLVWQHGHTDPENVLGHVLLENRPDGVYGYGFFNQSKKAIHTKEIVEHRDINMMSIWANQLIQRAGNVIHGAIREVSLVLSGANPGALIENVTIHHSDGDDTTLEDEVIIYTGLEIEHDDKEKEEPVTVAAKKDETKEDPTSVQEVYDTMNEQQKSVLVHMLGQALDTKNVTDDDKSDEKGDDNDDDTLEHAEDETVQDVYDSMTDKQKDVLHYMIGEALEAAGESVKQDNMNDDTNTEGNAMRNNVFEKGDKETPALSHSEIQSIVADATKMGSLKDAVETYALAHGITDIDVMFPDARTIADTPELIKRRTEWVSQILTKTRKSPFSRIKTLSADLTFDEARAKGYVKGALKKEEFFGVKGRVTTPTTIYKKQKLDRDDMLDITDFDVVTWLKGEMRVMLDEELARAILIGDGRDISNEDKINEGNIRPIAKDHELYTTTIYVNVDDANSSVAEVIDAIILNRRTYRGTGLPTMYTSETYNSKFLLLKDNTGRRLYKSLEEVASDLRVTEIVPVEILEEEPDIVCILVNPIDYVIGADKGGNVSMFDDFDIDYNQYKYLIETRCCGALTKLKSAIVVRKVSADSAITTPVAPAYDEETGEITITNTTGVVYKNGAGTVINAAGSPYVVTPGTSYAVNATPAPGYYFGTSDDDNWSFFKAT